jgi:hypothetical protein
LIAAVEKCFTKHGEKWLRTNCGGKLAKDESYGFLLADLVLGAIIPRDKAIALGEKLRKENKKIKTKLEQMGRDRAKALKELPPEEQGAEGVRHDSVRATYLATPFQGELPIPKPQQAAAGIREQTRAESKPALDPKPEPEPEPEPDHEAEAIAAEAEAEAAERDAAITACDAERAGKSLARLGPRPTARYIIGADFTGRYKNQAGVVVEQLLQLPAEERQHRDLKVKRWDLTETVWREKKRIAHACKVAAMQARQEAKLAQGEWQLAARERVIAAMAALSASNDRISACEDLVEAHECAIEMAERTDVAERAAFHAQHALQAMQAWGPDHASRPPAAVFDMRVGLSLSLRALIWGKCVQCVGWKVYVCL